MKIEEDNDCLFWFLSPGIGRSDQPVTDPEDLARRAADIITRGSGLTPSWKEAVREGVVPDRATYLSLLRLVCIAHAKNRLACQGNLEEKEVIQMVRILADLDDLLRTLNERIMDYYRVIGRSHNRAEDTISLKNHHLESHGIVFLEKEIEEMKKARKILSADIRIRAEDVMPNCSALAGPLVAARMLERAGSLSRLARLPASSIQVLGAETALFSHLTRGSPPPKHGIIYQHKRVHVSAKKSRGRVSRVFACKMAIGARIDLYRKEKDAVFLETSDDAIRKAGIRK